MQCGSCFESVIRAIVPGSCGDLVKAQGSADQFHVLFGKQWPEAEKGEAPPDCPLNVANFFKQGAASHSAGSFDAAGMMFRKTLESATKSLDATLAGQTLVKRIDSLTSNGIITNDLAAWAHEIRLGGNEAAHEEAPFSQKDSGEMKSFTENFLRYVFTLPAAVARRSGV
jgi:hypothetical protein